MFAGLSLFYPDVVIGRPGARCDALEAQNMIVCIPGARRCYQRTGLVNLGCRIYVHNLRDCAKMDEMLKASDWLLRLTPRACVIPPHYPLRASHLERHTTLFHTSRLERHTPYLMPPT